MKTSNYQEIWHWIIHIVINTLIGGSQCMIRGCETLEKMANVNGTDWSSLPFIFACAHLPRFLLYSGLACLFDAAKHQNEVSDIHPLCKTAFHWGSANRVKGIGCFHTLYHQNIWFLHRDIWSDKGSSCMASCSLGPFRRQADTHDLLIWGLPVIHGWIFCFTQTLSASSGWRLCFSWVA